MLKSENQINYEKLNTRIQEGGGLYNLEEIIEELKNYQTNFSTHAMNSHSTYLVGQRDMLSMIIDYLEKCL